MKAMHNGNGGNLNEIDFTTIRFYHPQITNESVFNRNKGFPSASLQYLEESMSMLGLSESHLAEPNMKNGIGSRIGRSLRQRERTSSSDGDEDALHCVKRRGIARPKKYTPSADQSNGTAVITKAIEKIYTNKSLGRVKITNLETIFENAVDEQATDVDGEMMNNSATAFGLRKLKRRLTFGMTKALKEKRKKRAVTYFGRGKRFKKISLEFFVQHMHALNASNGTENGMAPVSIECIDQSGRADDEDEDIQDESTNSTVPNGN